MREGRGWIRRIDMFVRLFFRFRFLDKSWEISCRFMLDIERGVWVSVGD